MSFLPVDEQLQILRAGVEEILTEEELREKLERSRKTGKPLRTTGQFKLCTLNSPWCPASTTACGVSYPTCR